MFSVNKSVALGQRYVNDMSVCRYRAVEDVEDAPQKLSSPYSTLGTRSVRRQGSPAIELRKEERPSTPGKARRGRHPSALGGSGDRRSSRRGPLAPGDGATPLRAPPGARPRAALPY